MINLSSISKKYATHKDKFFGSYNPGTDGIKVDYVKIEDEGFTQYGLVKREDGETYHGRSVRIFHQSGPDENIIEDGFWIDGQEHGPFLLIFPDGHHEIRRYDHGVEQNIPN